MPKNDGYLTGGFLNPLNWVIYFFSQVDKNIEHIKGNQIFVYSIISVLFLTGAFMLFNYFIGELLLKIFWSIILTIILGMGLYYNEKKDQRMNTSEEDIKFEKITRGLNDE
ncbi:MAG: hypothetical protein KAT05_12790 [Spirochaetes bacterium]|nr:hypothetical protein [Spirochaetota bacterium]